MVDIDSLDAALEIPLLAGSSCVIGVFDGLHAGHRKIIDETIAQARRIGAASVGITFKVDPDELFAPGFKKLMTNEQRVSALTESGLDVVIALPFDEAIAGLDPADFLTDLFSDNMPSLITVGTDFRFGKHAQGTFEDLRSFSQSNGATAFEEPLLVMDGSPVSSTRIREALADRDLAQARKLLGYPYEIVGEVSKGASQGRELGFRTANLSVDEACLAIPDGVYTAYAIVDGKRFKAAMSVGIPPTFEGERSSNVEAHILDFDDDIYGKTIVLQPVEYLRPMIKFDSVDELVKAVNENIASARALP